MLQASEAIGRADGIAAKPRADAAPVDAKLVTWPGSYKLKANEKIFYSALAQTRDGLPVMTDCDQYGAWDVAMVFEGDHRRPKYVWGFDDSAGQPSTAPADALSKETKALLAACDAEIAARQNHQTTLAWSGVTDDALLRRIRTALAQRAASQDSERDSARWQFMVEASAGTPSFNAYAAALNEQKFYLSDSPQVRKAAFIAAVDKARQKMAEQQAQEGGAA